MYYIYISWGFHRVKSILKKGDKRLFSSFQKAWEITPFPYVLDEPRNLRNSCCDNYSQKYGIPIVTDLGLHAATIYTNASSIFNPYP